LQIFLVFARKVVLGCAVGDQLEVAGRWLSVIGIRAADGEEKLAEPRRGFGRRGLFGIIAVTAVIYRCGLAIIGYVWEARCVKCASDKGLGELRNGRFLGNTDGGREGETWDEDLLVGCPAALRRDDLCVVFCCYLINDADKTVVPDRIAGGVALEALWVWWLERRGIGEIGDVRDLGRKLGWPARELAQGRVGETWFGVGKTGQVKHKP